MIMHVNLVSFGLSGCILIVHFTLTIIFCILQELMTYENIIIIIFSRIPEIVWASFWSRSVIEISKGCSVRPSMGEYC